VISQALFFRFLASSTQSLLCRYAFPLRHSSTSVLHCLVPLRLSVSLSLHSVLAARLLTRTHAAVLVLVLSRRLFVLSLLCKEGRAGVAFPVSHRIACIFSIC
jgi:hypothetical protein